MKPPEEVKLNREEGEALIERLQADRLTAEDRRIVEHVIRFHFWLTYALRETKISLSRLKKLLFGQGRGAQEEDANAEDTPDEQNEAEVAPSASPPSGEEPPQIGEPSAAAQTERVLTAA
jgi:hypothetical protein